MITKALAVLQEHRDAMKRRKMSEYYIRIDEAILELEELQETVRVLQNENVRLNVKLNNNGKIV